MFFVHINMKMFKIRPCKIFSIFFSHKVGMYCFWSEPIMMTSYINYTYNICKYDIFFTSIIHITDVKSDIFYINYAYD